MSDYVVSVNFQALSTAADALRAKAARFNEQVTQANDAAAPLRDSWVNSGSSAISCAARRCRSLREKASGKPPSGSALSPSADSRSRVGLSASSWPSSSQAKSARDWR